MRYAARPSGRIRAAARVPGDESSGGALWLWRSALAALFAAALAWRWAYLARLQATPFAGSLDADSRIYWGWSEYILRHGLVPPAPFFLAPLYPYVLAAWRALGAARVGDVLLVQALLGAASVVLLADATRRLAGRGPALVVGALLAFLQPTTFFAGLILPESLLLVVESALVWFVVATDWARATPGRFALYGLLIGILALGRASNALLMVLAIPLALASARGEKAIATGRAGGSARAIRGVALACAAFVLCALPATLANFAASHEPIPFTYNLGFNLYVGNNPEADGRYVDVTGGATPVPLDGASPVTGAALDGRAFLLATEGTRLTPAASSAAWAGKATGFITRDPMRALSLAGRKLALVWSGGEIPQIESMRSFAAAAGPLGLPFLGTFGALAVLALAAIPWAVRRGVVGRWLVGYAAAITLALAPFFVTDRYRIHLVPAIAVLAGVAIHGLAQSLRARAVAPSVARLAAAVVAASIVFAPIAGGAAPESAWGPEADRALKLAERGAYAEAAQAFAAAEAALGAAPAASLGPSARVDLAAFYAREGATLEALGRDAEAVVRWERAVALDPNDVVSLGRLAVAYERDGRAADAATMRARLAAAPGGRAQLLLQQGWAAAAGGDPAAAESLFRAAVHAAPDLALAWEGLIRVRIQGGRYADAARALDEAAAAGLDPARAAIYAAFLAAHSGDEAGARRALGRIPAGMAPTDPVLQRLLDDARNTTAAR